MRNDHGHAHGHGHGHAHGHGHGHDPGSDARTVDRAFLVGVLLNAAFVAIEAVFGFIAHSAALVADAAHNLSDVAGLLVAWGATSLAKRPPTTTRTYGFRRSTILAALANAVLLLLAVGGVFWEALGRLRSPGDVAGKTVMVVAAVGVVVNAVSAALFVRGQKRDANLRGAFLHLAADAAVSLAVVLAGLAIWRTGATWIDPVASIAVSVVVLAATWGLLRDSLHLALDGVPAHVSLDDVRAYLVTLPGVRAIHDLHVWAMSTTETALTVHLVMPPEACTTHFLNTLRDTLRTRFAIDHSTVQVESETGDAVCGCDAPVAR